MRDICIVLDQGLHLVEDAGIETGHMRIAIEMLMCYQKCVLLVKHPLTN